MLLLLLMLSLSLSLSVNYYNVLYEKLINHSLSPSHLPSPRIYLFIHYFPFIHTPNKHQLTDYPHNFWAFFYLDILHHHHHHHHNYFIFKIYFLFVFFYLFCGRTKFLLRCVALLMLALSNVIKSISYEYSHTQACMHKRNLFLFKKRSKKN